MRYNFINTKESTCRTCQKLLSASDKYYCSPQCRNKYNNTKIYQNRGESIRTAARERNKKFGLSSKNQVKRKRSGKSTYDLIKRRCTSPTEKSFQRYGARGIKLLLTMEEFLELFWRTDVCELCDKSLQDSNRMQPDGRQIHRINRDGDYCKDNVTIICGGCHHALTGLERALYYAITSSSVSVRDLLLHTAYARDILEQFYQD